MKDNNVVAFYCSNCHKTVWNYEHNFEQLHEKGLCAECLKKQNKPTISKMESVDNYRDKWQKLKEWLEEKKRRNERRLKEAPINTEFYIQVSVQGITINKILTIMQELEGEKDDG